MHQLISLKNCSEERMTRLQQSFYRQTPQAWWNQWSVAKTWHKLRAAISTEEENEMQKQEKEAQETEREETGEEEES
ncbi:hypothetical protein QE152_g10905 [Popillia japonica]|uniref:Uncharacterized protein n=1 Tax=Popillia japonica TaxID=7064 RepID=A0AAW1LU39_POPJA